MLLQKTKTKTAKPQNENTSKLVVKKQPPTQPLFEVGQCFDVEVYCKQTAEEQFSYMLENLNRSLFKVVLDKAWSKNYTVKFLLEKFATENKAAKEFASSILINHILPPCASKLSNSSFWITGINWAGS